MAFIRSFSRGDPGIGSWLKKAAKIIMPAASLANSKMGRSIGSGLMPGAAQKLISAGSMWQGMSRTELMNAATSTVAGRIGGGIKQLGGQILSGAARGFAEGLANRPINSYTVPPSQLDEYMATGVFPRKKYRRMNVANVKALRRSIRRVKGFAKIARQSLVLEKKVKLRKGRR